MGELYQAASASNVHKAALAYARAGMSVIPLSGKKPTLSSWRRYQHSRADVATVWRWINTGLMKNVGIICGAVSGNLAVIDLDGTDALDTYCRAFPRLLATYTVATGSGKGWHLYYRLDRLPSTTRALSIPTGGNIELRSNGTYIVAPPSTHPETRKPYRVQVPAPVMHLHHLVDVEAWIASFSSKATSPGATSARQAAGMRAMGDGYARAALVQECADVQAANEGKRNNRLNLAAYNLGQLIGDGRLPRHEVESTLLAAALAGGQSEREAVATIQSGIEAGMKNPRSLRGRR